MDGRKEDAWIGVHPSESGVETRHGGEPGGGSV